MSAFRNGFLGASSRRGFRPDTGYLHRESSRSTSEGQAEGEPDPKVMAVMDRRPAIKVALF